MPPRRKSATEPAGRAGSAAPTFRIRLKPIPRESGTSCISRAFTWHGQILVLVQRNREGVPSDPVLEVPLVTQDAELAAHLLSLPEFEEE